MSWRLRLALAALLFVLVGGAAALAARIPQLRIRVQDLEFLPTDSAVLAADRSVRETFGSDERVLVGLESIHDEASDPAFVADYRFFVHELVQSHNIGMLALDLLLRPRFDPRPVPGEPWLLHPPDAAWVSRALAGSRLTRELAVGRSRRVAFLEVAALSAGGVRSVEERVRAAFARLDARRPGRYRLHVIGRQVVLNALGEAIFTDLKRLLPWSFAVIFVILLASFRALLPALLALCEVGFSVVCTLGILQWMGHDLSLMTALVPVLVTVLGVADEIHLFGEFYRLKALHPDRPASALAWQAAGNVFFAVTATAFTTAVGFFSFLIPDVPALRVFGLVAGIGVSISWLFTLTLVPTLLCLLPTGRGPVWTRRPGPPLAPALFRGAFPVVLSLVVLPGVLRLRIDDGWTRNFRPDHPVVQEERWFRGESVGLHQFDLLLARSDGRRWTEPSLLAALDALEAKIRGVPDVTACFALPDLVRDRAWELGGQGPSRPGLPAAPAAIGRLLGSFRLFNEEAFARSFLDRDGARARLMVFTGGDDYGTSTRVRAALDRLVRQALGREVSAAVGGSAERGRVLIGTIVANQGQSVSASLLVAWLALGIASRRWWTSLRCVLANVWALALVLGVVGWAGLSLGVASSCFLALGVGTGLDYAIHLAFERETETAGAGSARLVQLRVLANVAAVGAGLGVLTLSANPTIRKLGLLIVLSMAASGYAALVFFPAPREREAAEAHPAADARAPHPGVGGSLPEAEA